MSFIKIDSCVIGRSKKSIVIKSNLVYKTCTVKSPGTVIRENNQLITNTKNRVH